MKCLISPSHCVQALELEDNIKTAYEYIQANADFDCIWRSIDDVQRQGGFETLIQAFFISEFFLLLLFRYVSIVYMTNVENI